MKHRVRPPDRLEDGILGLPKKGLGCAKDPERQSRGHGHAGGARLWAVQ